MPDALAPAGPTAGLDLPLAVGDARLAARPLGRLLSVSPFRGRAEAVAATLGEPLPAPGRARGRLVWMGLDLWFVAGGDDALAERLAPDAAVTDQSDAWAGFTLDGPAARAVLARLVPVDLHPDAFPDGTIARTPLRHCPAALLREGEAFGLLVFRSMAATAHHDLAEAMHAVAARAALR